MSEAVYPASRIKRRRSSKAEVERRRGLFYEIIAEMQPVTVRQVFYLATVRGLVPKTESGYDMVQSDLVKMRRAGELPYGWLADSTRWMRKPTTFDGVKEALDATARLYRKALWRDVGRYVEIWLEKDALSGVVHPVTEEYDVPLMVARGYSSLSFLHSAAEYIQTLGVPTYIYHFGDFDPSGVDAARVIDKDLRGMSGGAEIHFERLSVTEAQIEEWHLPTRPTKTTDSRAKKFGPLSVELDAIDPHRLRKLVREAIEQHMPAAELKVLQVAEESERELLADLVGLVGKLSGNGAADHRGQ
jgi:hypothetical protein